MGKGRAALNRFLDKGDGKLLHAGMLVHVALGVFVARHGVVCLGPASVFGSII